MKVHSIEDLIGFFDVMEVYGSHIDHELGFTIIEDNLVAVDYLLLNYENMDYRDFPDNRDEDAKERNRIPTIIEQRENN